MRPTTLAGIAAVAAASLAVMAAFYAPHQTTNEGVQSWPGQRIVTEGIEGVTPRRRRRH